MNKFILYFVILLLCSSLILASASIRDSKFCKSSGSHTVNCDSSCSCTLTCNSPSYETSDCWEQWAIYCAAFGEGGGNVAVSVYANSSWDSTGELADTCNYGGVCYTGSDSIGTSGSIYFYAYWGYCGLVDYDTLRGNMKFVDTGTFAGTYTTSDTASISAKGDEWTSIPNNRGAYKASEIKQVAVITQPYGYYPAQQLKMYYKGIAAYPDDYAHHKSDTIDDVCYGEVCEDLIDWDDPGQLGSNVDDSFDDGRCSVTCVNPLSVTTLKNKLELGFPVIVEVTGADLELEVSGDTSLSTSWGIGDYAEYNGVVLVVGNVSSNYYVYHPYNQKQIYTSAEFLTFYFDYGCYFDCDMDSTLSASTTNAIVYDVVTLIPDGDYETGGIFEPTCGCWDMQGDGDYEESLEGDSCYRDIESTACCELCPNKVGVYDGTEITGVWNDQLTLQKNQTGSQTIAFTAASHGDTDDRQVVFVEGDTTVTWSAPTITPILNYASGIYDNDINDNGVLIKSYKIGFNISGSTSTGINDYAKIWGALWNFTFRSSGITDRCYCVSNYTIADTTVINPQTWCAAAYPGCEFNNSEWKRIMNHTYDAVANFTATVTLVTVNWGSVGMDWNGTKSINFSYADPTLTPGFGNVIINGTNITDWSLPLTNPIIFNMNKTIFNEDYINWILIDYDSDGDEDYCYARDVTYGTHCTHNASSPSSDFTYSVSSNTTTSNNLQLIPITITPDSIVWANIKKNISVKMATTLNISDWVKHEFQFQSATLIAALRLVDCDSGTWITDYGDTILYNLNNSQFNRYNTSYININEVALSIYDCYDNILIKAICSFLGWLKFPSDWCRCVSESTERRDWNSSPILNTCYDYTDNGIFDKCISSYTTLAEEYWAGVNISDKCPGITECTYSTTPESYNWYLNYSLGINYGTYVLNGKICNLYGDCDNTLQEYTFEAPTYFANCSIVENANILVTNRLDSPFSHSEVASAISGTVVTIKVDGSVANNPYFPNRYTLVMYQGSNTTGQYLAVSPYNYRKWYSTPFYVFCNAGDIDDCSDEACNWFGSDVCDDITAIDWSTSFNFTSYDTEALHIVTIIGYEFDVFNDTHYSMATCNIYWSGPDIVGCIGPSPYDDDIDDDFKVSINSTNATIGFNPNCSYAIPRNQQFVSDMAVSASFINESFIGYSLANQTNLNITFNTTNLTNQITGACWDIYNDGIWDAYAGYVDCYNNQVEGGGMWVNLSVACNATTNLSANWYRIYNITRNDTNTTVIKLKVFDKCGATIANATQIGQWIKGGDDVSLCYNGVLDNEDNELLTSGSNTTSDYGGNCGVCTNNVLDNDETKTNYEKSGYDYGGYWCGYCDLDASKDEIWLIIVKDQGLIPPFNRKLCEEVSGSISVSSFLLLILLIIVTLFLIVIFIIPIILIIIIYLRVGKISIRFLRNLKLYKPIQKFFKRML